MDYTRGDFGIWLDDGALRKSVNGTIRRIAKMYETFDKI